MFSSPSVRLHTSENAGNLVQRKPGNNLTMRKPFLDRSVNSKTPDTGKLLKPTLKSTNKETVVTEKPKISPKKNLDAEDFMFSYKDVEDTYEDIWPKPRLSTEELITILRNYCNTENSPPPSPEVVPVEINPIFFELPEVEVVTLPEEHKLNTTFDVEMPELDYDESDTSR